MATRPTFDAKAPRNAITGTSFDDGGAAVFDSIARAAGQISGRLSQMAEQKRQEEAIENSNRVGVALAMPSVDFVFPEKGKSAPATGNKGEWLVSRLQADLGLTRAQAAGIAGNGHWESGGFASLQEKNPLVPGSRGGYGWMQWTGPRRRAFEAWAKGKGLDVASDEANYGFLLHELTQTPEGRVLGKLKNTRSADEAALVFSREFLRPGIPHEDKRVALARRYANGEAMPVQPGKVQVTLTGGAPNIPLIEGNTRYAKTYNENLLNIGLARAETAMREQMAGLAIQYENDPSGLQGALDNLKTGYMQDLPPEAQARLSQTFERTRFSVMTQAAEAFNTRQREQAAVAFDGYITSGRDSVLRMAAHAGTGETADAMIAQEMQAIAEGIDASPMTALQKSRAKRDLMQEVLETRITAQFDKIETPDARARFAQEFQRQYEEQDGYGGQVSRTSYERINAALIKGIQADAAQAQKRASAIDNQIDAQIGYLKKGLPVAPEAVRRLATEISGTGNPALVQQFEFLENLTGWQQAHLGARPEIIRAQTDALRDRMAQEGVNPAALTTLDVMESLEKNIRTELEADPLTLANRAGVTTIEPIDLSTPDTLMASLANRVSDAEAVAAHYDTEPRYFTPAETQAFRKLMQDDPLKLPALVSSLTEGLGRHAPRALAEISKDAPVLAHMGGLQAMTGDQRTAIAIAEQLDARRQEGFSSPLPSGAKIERAFSLNAGTAFMAVPGLRSSAMQVANVLFERSLMQTGADPDSLADAGSEAAALYADALDTALGARLVNGVKHGGLAEVNGVQTIAPADMPADELQNVFDNLTQADLELQMPITSANGVEITARQLRRAVPVNVGPGLYRLALGDPLSDDPRYVPSGDGYFVLDVNRLANRDTRYFAPGGGYSRP